MSWRNFRGQTRNGTFFLEEAASASASTSTRIRILGAPETPYTAYKGYYKKCGTEAEKSDLYDAHGGSSGRRHKKKSKEEKYLNNLKKARQAYKEEFDKSGDEKLAIEAMRRVECTFMPHKKEVIWSPELIKGLQREKFCAAGGCHDPCYRVTKGKHAKRRCAKYLKKHRNQYPKNYIKELNATEGSVPASILLEHLSLVELDNILQPQQQPQQPQHHAGRLQERRDQSFLNPSL
jgi:hypothetical protein